MRRVGNPDEEHRDIDGHPVHPIVAPWICRDGTAVAPPAAMLKLIGSYVIAKVLGFGLLGALVIYLLLAMLT